MEMRPHPVFSGYYVTPTGRVYSNRRNGNLREKKPTLQKNNGYYVTSIELGGGERKPSYYLHHLVAETYLGARPPSMVVNHIDGDKTNNNVENLEYVTQEYNLLHWRERRRADQPYEIDAPPLHTNTWWK